MVNAQWFRSIPKPMGSCMKTQDTEHRQIVITVELSFSHLETEGSGERCSSPFEQRTITLMTISYIVLVTYMIIICCHKYECIYRGSKLFGDLQDGLGAV